AADGTDYNDNGSTSVTLNPGVINKTVDLNPYDNLLLDGVRIGVATIAGPGSPGDYVVLPGTVSNVFFQIIDDDLAPETVLFSEDFEAYTALPANTVPAGWTFQFAAINTNLPDYTFQFGYDYSLDGIPPSPLTNTTIGLKATVNKLDANAAAAALNFYPTNASFSNNFALRFNMLLVNGTVNGTEHALFGVNHSGNKTNWWRSGGVGLGATT